MKLDQKGAIQFVVLLILLAGIVAAVYLVLEGPKIFKPKATAEVNVTFVDDSGNTITETASATVKVKLYSPDWSAPVSAPVSQSLVKEAYAQRSTSGGGGCSVCTADINRNGLVNILDFSILRSCFGKSATETTSSGTSCTNADIDGSGYVNIFDFSCLRAYFGQTCTQPSPSPSPTPTSGPVTTVSVVLAEDPNFTINKQELNFTTDLITYTFSNSSAGTKTLYVRFVASDGRTQNGNPYPATINLVPVSAPVVTPTSKRVFVTSTTYNGNLGGLSGADQKCQDRASAASLGGTWKAWLSSGNTATQTNTSPALRFTKSTVPYKLLSGAVVANDWTDLTDGTIATSISETELKTTYYPSVWTNTNFAGERYAGDYVYHCDYWSTDVGGAYQARVGAVGSWKDYRWTDYTNLACSLQNALYCFEQ